MNSYAHSSVRWELKEHEPIAGSYGRCTASDRCARKIIVTARRCSSTGLLDLCLVCRSGIVLVDWGHSPC